MPNLKLFDRLIKVFSRFSLLTGTAIVAHSTYGFTGSNLTLKALDCILRESKWERVASTFPLQIYGPCFYEINPHFIEIRSTQFDSETSWIEIQGDQGHLESWLANPESTTNFKLVLGYSDPNTTS